MRDLNIQKAITWQGAPCKQSQIKSPLALTEWLIGDVLAFARNKIGQLATYHPVTMAPDLCPYAQFAGRKPLRRVPPPLRELINILPSKTTDQAYPVGRSVFYIGRELILVEMPT